MRDTGARDRSDVEHERYDRLVATVVRLRSELAARGEGSAIDVLARATAAEAALTEARDELATAEVSNGALRRTLAVANALATKAEAKCLEWQEHLRAACRAAATGALRTRELYANQLAAGEQVRGELEQVRAMLGPLWPGNTGSALELARLAALTIGPAEPHEPLPDLVDLDAVEDEPAASSRSYGVMDIAQAALGALVVSAGIAVGVARSWPW